ncbi:MAG: TatD family hydrolase [Alteromonadaceae bacterium]|nr:TatD family hydrolase [Alteromonadaceae bacterium]
MRFTDSHCHLDFDEFLPNYAQLLEQCQHADIHRIIVPSIAPDNWEKVLYISQQSLSTQQKKTQQTVKSAKDCLIYPCLGIHPWFLKKLNEGHLQLLSEQVEIHRRNLVAIGETGIDNVIAKQQNNLIQQQDFFIYQLHLAKQHRLPVIVHHRRSHQYIIPLLKQIKNNETGVIHAFSGSYQEAKSYIDLGFKLGVGGTITYSRASKTINAIKRVPLTSLVLETDAPAMPLANFQGEPNSPLKLINVFQCLTTIRNETPEQISEQIEYNIQDLFFTDTNLANSTNSVHSANKII